MADGRSRRKSMAGKSCWLLQAQPLSEPRSAGTEAAQVTCSGSQVPRSASHASSSGQRRCRVFREVRPHVPKEQEITSLRLYSANWKHLSHHNLRHNCNQPLLLRALQLPRPTISLEHSPCNGRAAVQQTPTMPLQPSTPSLDAHPPRAT